MIDLERMFPVERVTRHGVAKILVKLRDMSLDELEETWARYEKYALDQLELSGEIQAYYKSRKRQSVEE